MTAVAPARRVTNSRDRILRAARKVFLANGYATSLDEVAREAGVGRRTLYNQFESKDALLRAVIGMLSERMIEPLFANIPADAGIEEYLRTGGRRYLDTILADENLQIYRFFVTDLRGHSDLLQLIYAQGYEKLTNELAAYLGRQIADGVLRTMDTAMAADLFLGAIVGPARHRAILGLGVASPKQRAAIVAAAVDCFLRGLHV